MAGNVKALAMWLEFIASPARLPMLGKGKMLQVNTNAHWYTFRPNYSPIALLPPNGMSVKPAI
jgi:hypothetical protein